MSSLSHPVISGAYSLPLESMTAKRTSIGSQAVAPETATAEVRFLQKMIDHHRRTIQASQVILDNSDHSALVDFCEDMVAIQSAELETMEGWLSEWYGVKRTSLQVMSVERARLEDLSNGAREQAFLEMLVADHRHAIIEGRLYQRRGGGHQELQVLCDEIVTALQNEVLLISRWLCDWFGLCEPD